MPINSDHEMVTSAALGDNDDGIYAIHLVNNGATREATISGLPDGVTELRIFTSNTETDMEEGTPVQVQDGRATFTLEATSFVSLMTDLYE